MFTCPNIVPGAVFDVMRVEKAKLSHALAVCFEELNDAKTLATHALAAYEVDKEDVELAAAQGTASCDVEPKRLAFESAREAVDAATIVLDDEYIRRQPTGKVALAIVKKRAATVAHEVRRLRAAHIACQKAVERAMQSKKPVVAEVFKKLREAEVNAKDALDKAIQD